MIHGDEADVAAALEEQQRESALAQLRASAPGEDPDEDEEGNRYCLDCGDTIPEARVRAVNAVRCVYCASVRERGNPRKMLSHRGIRRYLKQDEEESPSGETFSLGGEDANL